jgi:hypothetical protein
VDSTSIETARSTIDIERKLPGSAVKARRSAQRLEDIVAQLDLLC